MQRHQLPPLTTCLPCQINHTMDSIMCYEEFWSTLMFVMSIDLSVPQQFNRRTPEDCRQCSLPLCSEEFRFAFHSFLVVWKYFSLETLHTTIISGNGGRTQGNLLKHVSQSIFLNKSKFLVLLSPYFDLSFRNNFRRFINCNKMLLLVDQLPCLVQLVSNANYTFIVLWFSVWLSYAEVVHVACEQIWLP
jgi:hypothetical protein